MDQSLLHNQIHAFIVCIIVTDDQTDEEQSVTSQICYHHKFWWVEIKECLKYTTFLT